MANTEQQIHSLFTRDTRINLGESEISITEDQGQITLSGTVPTVAAKRLAVRLAESVRRRRRRSGRSACRGTSRRWGTRKSASMSLTP